MNKSYSKKQFIEKLEEITILYDHICRIEKEKNSELAVMKHRKKAIKIFKSLEIEDQHDVLNFGIIRILTDLEKE